ncbi:MAG: phosphoglycerate dehydrogenase [Bacillota bacterium]|nr:phosphoglycerate dehydrogenase [Bacillota bacterium]
MNILITTSSFSTDSFPEYFSIIKNPYGRKLTESEVLELILKYKPAGMIAGVEPLTRNVLSRAKELKVISRCGTGLDSVDLDAAKELGISVLNTPDAPTEAVAELTTGAVLSLLRKISTADALVKSGNWKQLKGNLLSEKTVGIIGVGRIGTRVAEIMNLFECRLLGYDPFIKEHRLCEMKPLDELLRESDIVTLHVPYTESNHHIIAKRELSLMKKTAQLVNIARGGLVDEEALCEALKTGTIAGAAIDCFEQEPYKGELISMGEKVVLTAHMGSAAAETRKKMELEAVKNLLQKLKELGLSEA